MMVKLVGGLVSCALAACIAAGCTSARTNLGTSDSSCYLALPSAAMAVGSHSRLTGVHLFTLDDLHRRAPRFFKLFASEHAPSSQRVCVFAFAGAFTEASVSKPLGRTSGPVAIVVLKAPSNQLFGTVILRRLPLRFSHSHIG
jgi:hypothetical protein